jgi:hypothetical protein
MRRTVLFRAVFNTGFAALLLQAANPAAAAGRLVLTSMQNGTEPQSSFQCAGRVHGYLRLPARFTGVHQLEGVWTLPNGQVIERSRIPLDFGAEGGSTAYLWLDFPSRSFVGGINPDADRERLSYNGPWKVKVLWDEKFLLEENFLVQCS